MSQIIFHNMSFDYSGHYKPVFQEVHLILDTQWRLGLVGRNGRGKTTLLRLIHGTLKPDSGTIYKTIETELFPYVLDHQGQTVGVVMKNAIGGLAHLERQMEFALDSGTPEALAHYNALLEQYQELDGFTAESRIQRELAWMGLSPHWFDRPFETLSGGEKTKIEIACLFLRPHRFVLLDEPTNHLDLEGKETLIQYLSKKTGYIVVSHDRDFLDQTTDHILSIVKTDIQLEKGNYSSWHENRKLEDAYELRRHENLTREIAVLEKSARESRRFSFTKEGQKRGAFDKGAVGAQGARLMQRAKNTEHRKTRMLEDKQKLLKNYESPIPMEIKQEPSNHSLITVQDLSFRYPQNPLLTKVNLTLEAGERLWIQGNNGAGKSTLLNLIRGRLQPDAGIIHRAPNLLIAESYQTPLWQEGNLAEHLQTDKINGTLFRTVLSYFNMGADYFLRPLETFSQGELKKVDIARALSQTHQLLILDEPLNYMDILFRDQLEVAILKASPSMIFIEHDRRFGEAIATHVLGLEPGKPADSKPFILED